jgi:hypothetical protein
VTLHTYVVEHDFGFAPNPFYGVCSLGCCKQDMRKVVQEGHMVVGTGSKRVGRAGHLTFWMMVDEIISFDEYWIDARFRRKRAFMRGSAMQRFGDNIYHTDPVTGEVVQEDSFHSREGGLLSEGDREADTGKTNRVLLARDYAYYGGEGPKIPSHLVDFVFQRQGWKYNFSKEREDAFMDWLSDFPKRGYLGEPADWKFVEL